MTTQLTPVQALIARARDGRRVAIVAACAVMVLPALLLAQAGPPLARPAQDSAPALRKPVAPNPPPSAVAPRGPSPAAVRATPAEVAPSPRARISAPVDSVRPAVGPPPALDPARTPPAPPPPSLAAPRASPGAAQASARAALASDAPPAGATARCKDGVFVTSLVDANTCSGNMGLAATFPTAPAPPRRPNP